ncbi:hypothetical protein EYV94_10915 [Puteibacter caeruleilacunae]|nr:hypothetical protein EYV94_10915 [Puteibacter caeruleilacunae]
MILLDLSGIIDVETFHEYVSKRLNFLGHYGGNFDAFWDCFLDLDEDSYIRVEGLAELKKNLPDTYAKFMQCMEEYRQDIGRMRIDLVEDSPSGEGVVFEE